MKRWCMFLSIMAAVSLNTTPSLAGSGSICPDITGESVKMCLSKEVEKIETELASAYEKEMQNEKASTTEPETLKKILIALEASKEAFVNYRKFQCTSEAYMAIGGSMQSELYFRCILRLTSRRIADLQILRGGMAKWSPDQ